jgi:alkanesulfonate monooxygenase SsuD/methylene tetrahydromethanopterin reductase-like flavin-dependent oxidoreductase (luciferase family)
VSTIRRIQATDLRDAQRQTTKIRLAEERQGRDPTATIVLLDVEAVIEHSNRSAFDTLDQLERASPDRRVSGSVVYVGTANGLAGMITDVYAADVANGVMLLPLTIPAGFVRIVESTLCLLQARGFDFDAR